MIIQTFAREEHILRKGLPKSILDAADKSDCFVSGGAITCVFTGRKINDYDFYFRTESDIALFEDALVAMEKTFIDWQALSAAKRKKAPKPPYSKMLFESNNARSWFVDGMRIQVIKYEKFIGFPEQVFHYFDFTCCMGSYSFKEKAFHLHNDFLLHNAQKRIVFQHTTEYPIVSLVRVNKYIKYGYRIGSIDLIKLALTINSLALNNYHAIKKQLMGIDTLFLKPLTDWLGNNPEEAFDLTSFMEKYEQVIYDAYQIDRNQIMDEEEGISALADEIIKTEENGSQGTGD